MPKEKACRNCKRIYEGDICPICERRDTSDAFKGKIEIINTEKSEIGEQLKINKKGIYAIKL